MYLRRKILIGVLDHCGYFSGVYQGLLELGEDAFFLNLGNDKYIKDANILMKKNVLFDTLKKYHEKYFSENRNAQFASRKVISLIYHSLVLLNVIYLCLVFKCIILNSGSLFTISRVELKLLKLFGVKIVVSFHGSDSRPPYLQGGFHNEDPKILYSRARQRRDHVLKATRYADLILDNPLCSHFHVKKVCCYTVIGMPISNVKNREDPLIFSDADGKDEPVTILHAPTNLKIKGTDKVRSVIAKLKQQGYKIEYLEVTNISREELFNLCSSADIVIDQLYSDIHGAVFAMEACMLGRPVIVGGYGKRVMRQYVPDHMIPKTVFCEPEEFEKYLVELIKTPELRREIGYDAKEYFYKYVTPKSVAGRILSALKSDAPASWFFNPSDIRYLDGMGGESKIIRSMLTDYIRSNGAGALLVDDKPELKNYFLEELELNLPD